MKRLITPKIVLLLLTVIALKTEANDQDKTAVYSFQSESITYRLKKKELIYQGKVKVTEDTTVLTGTQLTVQYEKSGEIKKLILIGLPARYSTIPKNKTARLYAQAKKIIYNLETKKIVLIKNAKITFKANVFTGPIIWYDVEKGIVRTLPQEKNKQTKIILPPQSE